MLVLTVVGARPQFVKASMVSRAFASRARQGVDLREEILHTGQHYDPAMSQVFFDQLAIPRPVANLEVGSGSHGEVTARMLLGIEAEILARRPDWVLVYGDTNSTLAGALAASKLHVPVAHVEAGLRSYDQRMPEEVNRVVTDHLSRLLLAPTRAAVDNLAREGLTRGVRAIGDVMFDAARVFGDLARRQSDVLQRLRLEAGGYFLATVHRAENVDDPARLSGILEGLGRAARSRVVLLPLHPRTRARILAAGLEGALAPLRVVEPAPFLDMVRLEQEARAILTDSGGVQKEAYFHGVPCVTLREVTEWVETVEAGWNRLVGADPARLEAALADLAPGRPIPDYGTGGAAEEVVDALLRPG